MSWNRNPRTITKEQFSTGTTIDGNRIDNALDDVVERVSNVPYGDLRKRWVPITYVAGWTPQAPNNIEAAAPVPTGGGTTSEQGAVFATHHWPWLRVRNIYTEVVKGTTGAVATDDPVITNPYRLKGVRAPGVFPFGASESTATVPAFGAGVPIGAQYAWTRSWYIEKPSILDAIDLMLERDQADASDRPFKNSFLYADRVSATEQPPDGYDAEDNDQGLAIVATVDNEFALEDRNMADIEVLRKRFSINRDQFSRLPLPEKSDSAPTYTDFTPKPSVSANCPATTLGGIYIPLRRLNIPIHQNARLRISVVIPSYDSDNRPCGWNPNDNSADFPWLQQKIHMTVTMLEEVTSG